MTGPLENLRTIRDELHARNWVVTCFTFPYKDVVYFVLVERYLPPRVAPAYQIVQLTFAERRNTRRTLSAPANTYRIGATAKEIREYFGIEYRENLGDILNQFHERLGIHVPDSIPADLSNDERRAIIDYLDRSDGEEEGRIHCMGVRRNGRRKDGTPGRRSSYNDQKTMMLRPELHNFLANETNVSFMYSTDPSEERTDAEILQRFRAQ